MFEHDGRAGVSTSIRVGEEVFTIGYAVSGCPIAEAADGWLAATLIPAMWAGGPLRLTGSVSPRLYEASATIQDILHAWNPQFARVTVEAEPRHSLSPLGGDVGCFFSGGVDSWYTLLKHRHEITALIAIDGYDIFTDERRQRWQPTLRAIAKTLQLPLIEVRTNLRAFSDRYALWPRYYNGAALASVALLLSARFRKVYVPSTHDYADLFPEGSHPLLDPLWSTEQVELVHDGCEATRFEKIERLLESDLADLTLAHLQVCNKGWERSYNCGVCGKCLRTMVSLRLLGALDRCPTFDRPLDLAKVARSNGAAAAVRCYIEENLQAAQRLGADAALIEALRCSVDGVYRRGPRGWPRRAVNRLLGRLR